MALEKFERLEDGLVRLLAAYERLSAENLELKASIASKDGQLADYKEKIGKLEKERDQVREKVDGLLARLEGLIQGA